MLEEVYINNELAGILFRNHQMNNGAEFLTDQKAGQQVARMKYSAGDSIMPHFHNKTTRVLDLTTEVLVITKGVLRIDFYNGETYQESKIAKEGDIILLNGGSHGFKILQELQMIEIKQGPYAGNSDKVRFKGIDDSDIIIK